MVILVEEGNFLILSQCLLKPTDINNNFISNGDENNKLRNVIIIPLT